ncbi:unnamed protein product [Alopecurus aequalis]
MATGPDLTSFSAADAAPSSAAKKDRHIVSWSAEEDDVLRAQIAHHGIENWTVIATQFKDKTARQCRRRWFNYLNTECKKGGWSREEDMLLCEAQKLLGNKWTEIAKVVSGRTDNAVKNRFSTLCKRRANNDDPFEENGAVCSNANAKRVLTQTVGLTCGAPSASPPIKNLRSCKPDFKENIAPNMRPGQEKSIRQDSRQPLADICPDGQSVNIVETQNHVTKTSTKQLYGEEQSVKHEGNFLKKNDPKFATLLQQADLLSSLATKVSTENTSQSMDEAWQKLQCHLVKKDDNDNDMSESSMSGSGTASLLEDLDDLIVDPYENEEEDEQNSSEHNGVTSEMATDHIMDNCPVDQSTEDNSLCGITLASYMKPSPGAEILAYVNSDESAGDRGLHCMEYSSPEHTALQARADAEILAPVDLSEAVEGSWSQFVECLSPAHTVLHAKADAEIPASVNSSGSAEGRLPQCVEYTSPAHTLLPAKADAEIPAPVNLSEAAEGSWSQFMEYSSPAHTVLHAKADADIPASVNSSEAAEGRLRVEYMSPAHTLLPAKTDPEIPAPVNFSEAAKDGSLQCTESASPAHTDLQANADAEISEKVVVDSSLQHIEFTSPAHRAIKGKAGVKKLVTENCSKVPKDSDTHPCMEFTSPAHTVPTFHPYADNVPTPKITASEKNFLLSVLGLTSPGSKPDTSQQPSCKRALLNSL